MIYIRESISLYIKSGYTSDVSKIVDDSKWHHIICIREGSSGNVKIYIDGIQYINENLEKNELLIEKNIREARTGKITIIAEGAPNSNYTDHYIFPNNGLLSTKMKNIYLAQCRELLGLSPKLPALEKISVQQFMLDYAEIDISKCPYCKTGNVKIIGEIEKINNLTLNDVFNFANWDP